MSSVKLQVSWSLMFTDKHRVCLASAASSSWLQKQGKEQSSTVFCYKKNVYTHYHNSKDTTKKCCVRSFKWITQELHIFCSYIVIILSLIRRFYKTRINLELCSLSYHPETKVCWSAGFVSYCTVWIHSFRHLAKCRLNLVLSFNFKAPF